MSKLIVDRRGKAEEIEGKERKKIPFPVCLQIRYGKKEYDACADFILNITKGEVFILSPEPFLPGMMIVMGFSIPDEKVLGEFKGEVVAANTVDPGFPKGMQVRFVDCTEEELKKLEEYLECRRHLVDKKV